MTGPVLPRTHPLPHLDVDAAFGLQQRLVAAAGDELPGAAMFTADAGVRPETGRPRTTAAVERVLATAFGAQAACLVQGAGTGAIRTALSAGPWEAGDRRLLVHDAPDYSTTATTFRDGMVQPVRADFDLPDAVQRALADPDGPAWVYIQHSRQRLTDSFDPMQVVAAARAAGRRVIVDENYAAVRTPAIGTEHGASASAFSLFKLHGPEGIGVVLGDDDLIETAHRANYSGGGQVQGHQALHALQALVNAPLNWARQSAEVHRLAGLLGQGAVPGIVDAKVANVQDLCVVALLAEPEADRVRAAAATHGAAPYPVGSNSRFEVAPMIYRLSSSALSAQPELRDWTLRINPMRAGADLVVDILRRSIPN
ncbi:aminotransferase class V-fold PLP-dependent enzyme [Ruania zhangjianzhongii]|uniref:aminotransferase class V-fold PLP-dependent enzyme n=1 Tax=Ruania zhangjianzhongii TaxID=2603206 RepID=UPI0011CB7B05|nr:aminotransferase class V-fold PLP-dependent enzyme [Ruania zhangjianzhongii]